MAAHLPTHAFGHRCLTGWGVVPFLVSEGTLVGIGLVLFVVRGFKFNSLNVMSYDNAYGSIMWALPVFELALRHEGWYVAQHLSFVFRALLFWWANLHCPRGRRPGRPAARRHRRARGDRRQAGQHAGQLGAMDFRAAKRRSRQRHARHADGRAGKPRSRRVPLHAHLTPGDQNNATAARTTSAASTRLDKAKIANRTSTLLTVAWTSEWITRSPT